MFLIMNKETQGQQHFSASYYRLKGYRVHMFLNMLVECVYSLANSIFFIDLFFKLLVKCELVQWHKYADS